MALTGKNFIGKELSALGSSAKGSSTFKATDPAVGTQIEPAFFEATIDEINLAIEKAESAFQTYRSVSGNQKADFLDAIAEQIMALGDELVDRACLETGLPQMRIQGERGRTCGQLGLFARLLREGSWVDARIDLPQPDRQPIPKVDIRSMQKALGPVTIFGASNFPLAFSVAGGDSASALAAGCTIVVKAHPSHPGTCELIATAILKAVEQCGLPDGTFSMIAGTSVDVGLALVRHPLIKAVGFTGSNTGGKALFDAAAQRDEPIPVYAEMGSTNPIFILPGAVAEQKDAIANGFVGSVTLGTGQFCTSPGLLFLEQSAAADEFQIAMADAFTATTSACMLTEGIQQAFDKGTQQLANQTGVEVLAKGTENGEGFQGTACYLKTTVDTFLENALLEDEVFGPSTLAVIASDKDELLKAASSLSGHLTVTLWATDEDLSNNAELIQILERKTGRLIINSFPTGVEVCDAMVHGGPYPATTDSRTTSVGTGAIHRFTRPLCYQGFPDQLLPAELQNANPLQLWRLIDGVLSKD